MVLTVAITTAAEGLHHPTGLIDISFHVPSLHRICVMTVVVRRMMIIVVVLLRREIGMVNLPKGLLIALWHSIVRIVHWRWLVPSLAIVKIRRAD